MRISAPRKADGWIYSQHRRWSLGDLAVVGEGLPGEGGAPEEAPPGVLSR